MLDAWKKSRRKEKEAKWLAEIRARDADVGIPTPETLHTRFQQAALAGQWDIVDDCVQKGSSYQERIFFDRNDHSFSDKHGGGSGSLVVSAVLLKDVKGLERAIANGVNVNERYSTDFVYAYSPLYIAVYMGKTEAVKLLCENGADLTDTAPLRLAEGSNLTEIIRIIRAEETKRAAGQISNDTTAAARGKIISDVADMPLEAREKLMASLREKFPAPVTVPPASTELAQDVQILKPLSLKKQARP